MKQLLSAALFAALLVGCAREAPPPQKGGGINITAPGVNISIDDKGGAKVQAPGGVNVEAGQKGAKVEAPGAKVNVDKQ